MTDLEFWEYFGITKRYIGDYDDRHPAFYLDGCKMVSYGSEKLEFTVDNLLTVTIPKVKPETILFNYCKKQYECKIRVFGKTLVGLGWSEADALRKAVEEFIKNDNKV